MQHSIQKKYLAHFLRKKTLSVFSPKIINKMKKILTLFTFVFILTFVGNEAKAQAGFHFGGYFILAQPTGDLSEYYAKTGYGGGLEARIELGNISLGVDGSYIIFSEKKSESNVAGTVTSLTNSLAILPIKVGAEYSFGPAVVKPFISFDLGNYTVKNTVDLIVDAAGSQVSSSSTSNESYFGVAPGAGVMFKLPGVNFKAKVHYNKIFSDDKNADGSNSNISFMGVNLSAGFGL